jgi:hypothetical protein
MRHLGILALLLAFSAFPREGSAQPKPPVKRTTFDEHVLPILKDKCVACHGPDKKRGGLVLNNYLATMQGGSSGASVKPGDPENSLLYQLMAHTREPIMPPKSPKPEAQVLAVIHKWIADGAPENSGSKVTLPDKPKTDFTLKAPARGKPAVPPMPPATLRRDPVVKAERDTAITALAANPWSPLVAVAGQKQVLLYHADTLELLGVLPFPEGTVNVLKFSRNGGLLLAGGGQGGKSGKVAIWSVTTGERLFTVGDETDAVLAADVSPDQSLVALGGPSKMVRVYSTRDGKLAFEMKKHTDWVTALEFSPDGVLLATGDRNGGLLIWEAANGREFHALRGPTSAVTAVSWRPDSNVVAVSSEDATVRLFEMENGGQIRNWGAHGGGALDVSYGMDGRLISAGRDRTARLWDGNGAAVRAFEAFPDLALKAVLTHDGKRAIAGDWTGQIIVYSTTDGVRLGTLTANPAPLADQIAQASRDVAEKLKLRDALLATSRASEAALAKATADFNMGRKAVEDTAAAAKAAEAKLNQARATLANAQAALKNAQQEAQAKQVLAAELADAAARVRAAADRVKDNPALAAAAARALALSGQASAELVLAQKAADDLAAALRAVEPAVAPAQQAYNAALAAAQNAPKALPALEAALKAAQAKAAADKAPLAAAEAALKQAQDREAQLKKSAPAPAAK